MSSMIDEFNDVFLVVGTGATHLVNPPERLMRLLGDSDMDLHDWEEGNLDPKSSLPSAEGVYILDIQFWYSPGYYEGYYAPAESDWWIECVNIRRIRIPKPQYVQASDDVFLVESTYARSMDSEGRWSEDSTMVEEVCGSPTKAKETMDRLIKENAKSSFSKRKYRTRRMPITKDTPADIKGDLYG